jgi:hypothetical protein
VSEPEPFSFGNARITIDGIDLQGQVAIASNRQADGDDRPRAKNAAASVGLTNSPISVSISADLSPADHEWWVRRLHGEFDA